MWRPERLWVLSEAWALRRLRIRGRLLMLGGRLLRDEFMTLAGRCDLTEARRRPVPGTPARRIRPRRA